MAFRACVLRRAIDICEEGDEPSPPGFLGVGATAFLLGNGSMEVPMPSGLRDDDVVLINLQGRAWINPLDPNPTITAGWSAITTDFASGNTITRVYWKRVSAGEPNPTLTYTGGNPTQDHMLAAAARIGGCPTAGNPWDVFAGLVDATDAVGLDALLPGDPDGLTTTQADDLVVYCVGSNRPNADGGAFFSGWTSPDLVSITEDLDVTHTSFVGSGIAFAHGTKVAAGTVQRGTVDTSFGSPVNVSCLAVALQQ
jgi:hypothetical protein